MSNQRRCTETILLVAGLTALGIACTIISLWSSALWPSSGISTTLSPRAVPWMALVVAFVLGDRVDISLEVRDHAVAVTPAHFILVFGLFTASPEALISARMVGGVVALALLRDERDGMRVAFNLALYLFEVASATALVQVAPWWTGSALEARNWLTVLGGMALYTAVALAVILSAIRLSSTRSSSARWSSTPPPLALGAAPHGEPVAFGRIWLLTSLAETANAALGLVAVLLWQLAPWALLLLLPPAGVSYLAYLGFTRLSGRHENLERLYAFTSEVSRLEELDAVVEVTLQEAATVLNARRAELLLLADGQPVRWLVLDIESTSAVGGDACSALSTPPQFPRWEADPMLATVVSSRSAVLHSSGTARTHHRHGDAVAVPLLAGSSLLGVLLVRGRIGHRALFDRSDVTALSTLANHVGMAVENLRLIARLRDQAEEREQLALHDALTGLGNRRLFHRSLSAAMADRPTVTTDADQTSADQTGIAVLLVDLNGFKDVNDTLGHDAGDRLLQAIAVRLQTYAGPTAAVTRLGGDEFAVLVDPCTVLEAQALAHELLRVVEQPVQMGGMQLVIGAAVGLACAPWHATDEASLLQKADLALYAAKARHDTSVEVFQPEHGESSARRLTMASDLRQALERRALHVHYQPQIDLQTKRVVAAEALLRWHHPSLGDVSPDEFVAVAEHLGLVDHLTRFVVEEAVAQAARWRRCGLDLEMAINISVRNLLEPAFPDHLASTLSRYQVAPQRITLEITETELMHEASRASEVLASLHRLGVGLSIDDFGTGYSSLAYLKRLPVAELKLDRSFVRDLATDSSDAMIARTVIDLAGNLELRVVAEGIEDIAALDALVEMGCERGQGFLFSHAVGADELFGWAQRMAELGSPSRTIAASPVDPAQPVPLAVATNQFA